LACNAPIAPLHRLGIEIEENSELDLYAAFHAHAGDARIPDVVAEMEEELGEGNKKPEILAKLAQYELTLLDWVETHKGARKYVAIAGKCWPAFQTEFQFVPCYVNSRLTAKGIPVSCEVDIYGVLSEFIGTCVSRDAVTLLDINNSVPADLYAEKIKNAYPYSLTDTFMGFHCGNTPVCKLSACEMKYQKIMARTHRVLGNIRLHATQVQIIGRIEHTAVGVAAAVQQAVAALLRRCAKHHRAVKLLGQSGLCRLRTEVAQEDHQGVDPGSL
jgi:L-fucose isomerase-like protein